MDTMQGQLKRIVGSVDLKNPVGVKVAAVFFKDDAKVRKGELLLQCHNVMAATVRLMSNPKVRPNCVDAIPFTQGWFNVWQPG